MHDASVNNICSYPYIAAALEIWTPKSAGEGYEAGTEYNWLPESLGRPVLVGIPSMGEQ